MLEPQVKTIGGKDFQFRPLPVFKAARLDKRVLGLLVPILGGLEAASLTPGQKLDLNLEGISKGIRAALEGLPDAEYEMMLVDLLAYVVYLPSGGAPVELNDAEQVNRAFAGDLITLYKVLFEVMRFNKFTPFALAATGGLLTRIAGFSAAAGNSSTPRDDSAR